MKKFKQFLPILILVGVAFAIFAFNLSNPLFWDDDDWIKGNVFVHDFSHLKEIFTRDILSGFGLNSNYYRPILLLSFAVNYAIGGIKPLGYHLVNNGFHIANGILVFSILYLVFRKRLPAFFAALLFLIHPLQTEAVTYISGRGDSMSVFFILLALWFFIKSLRGSTSKNPEDEPLKMLPEVKPPLGGPLGGSTSKCRGWYLVGSLLSMVAAILSRETAVLFPALAMIFYVSFLHHRNPAPAPDGLRSGANAELIGNTGNQHKPHNFLIALKISFVKTIPFFCVSVAYVVLRLTVFNFQNTLNFYSQANDYTQHLSYRLYTFGHALVEYFKLIFAPVGLHMERDLPLKTSLFQWPVPIAVLMVVAVIFILVVFYRKEKRFSLVKFTIPNSQFPIKSQNLNSQSESPKESWKLEIGNWKFPEISDFRVWFFGWSWFFVAMIPVSGIIPINAVMYEHWLYLPLIGLFAIAGFYLTKLLNFQGSTFFKIQGRTLIVIALVGYFSFFAYQSIQRNILWGKTIEFYEDIIKYNPNTVRIMNNLANLYSEKGETGKAEELYVKAIESPNGNIFAQPHYNLGNIYRDRGETEKAVVQYREAVKADPTFPFAYQNLAVIYASRGDLVEAALMLEKVKELKPQDSRVYYNLGLVYLAQNKKALALENLKMAFKFSGGDPEVAAEIRRILEQLGR